VVGGHSEFGRVYNEAAQTGLLAPIDTPVRELTTLLDDRKGLGEKAAQLLGGVRIASVDPDIAESQAITELLSRNPQVRSVTSYFQPGQDPDVDRQIEALKQAKANLAMKRETDKGPIVARLTHERTLIERNTKLSEAERAKRLAVIDRRLKAAGYEPATTH
jgi:hypothetical protein